MPRASTYAKSPERYKRRVKASRYIKEFEDYGFHVPESFLNIGKTYDVVDYAQDIMKLTKTKTLAKTLRIICRDMENKRFYSCDGYSFVPLSVYEKHFTQMVVVFSTWDIGRLRVNEWLPVLKQMYPQAMSYSVYINPIDEKGVDVLVRKDGMPHTVFELTNYSAHTYLSFKDANRYMSNLNEWDKYNAHKVIVVSFASNLKHKKKPDLWEEFPKNNIGIKIMGHQA